MIVQVIGVSGCGKSTIGKLLAAELDLPFYDADDFHSRANIDKMKSGRPLDDADRSSWLETLSDNLQQWEKGGGAVLACSALKEKYRAVLGKGLDNNIWVFLSGPYELIYNRMQHRTDHYMSESMLRSQFEALEVPEYGIHADVHQRPDDIVAMIKKSMSRKKSEFGVFGLGVMGSSLSLNMADKGIELSVFNRTDGGEEHVLSDFMSANSAYDNIRGYTDLKMFIESLSKPRKILIMIKAGPVVDLVLEKLLTYLEEGDIIIDGGNSHYGDTQRRFDLLIDKGIHFIGAGISGGEEGARKGPSIMPGGSRDSYSAVADILESIAARDPFGNTCCTYIGPGGSGHFIKMVHNGIEYVEMQLLAEMYALMSLEMSNESIANVLETWNQGALSSYLLDITVKILRKMEGEQYVLDLILDKAGNKGTGSWSSKAAFDMGVPNTLMSAAVFARYVSSFKEERKLLSEAVTPDTIEAAKPDLNQLEKAYSFARLINHQQGFKLMRLASDINGWKLNFKDIARIWSNGCIIKSQLMNQLYEEFGKEDDLLKMNVLIHELSAGENAVRELVKFGLDHRISLHCFTSALYYWTDMTSDRLPANLIQAQRDFFGAHTYQRTDRDPTDYFHTKWT